MNDWKLYLKNKIHRLYFGLMNDVDVLKCVKNSENECEHALKIIDSLLNQFVRDANYFRNGYLKKVSGGSESSAYNTLYNYTCVSSFIYLDGDSPWDFTLKCEQTDDFDVVGLLRALQVNDTLTRLTEPYVPGTIVFCNCKYPFRGILLENLEIRLKVFNIDTGINKIIKPEDIYKLPSNFLEIPAQVIKCTLGKELWLKDKWTDCLSEAFVNFMRNSTFSVSLIENMIYTSPSLFQVNLVASNTLSGLFINITTWYNNKLVPFLVTTTKIDTFSMPAFVHDPFICQEIILPGSAEEIGIQVTPEEDTSGSLGYLTQDDRFCLIAQIFPTEGSEINIKPTNIIGAFSFYAQIKGKNFVKFVADIIEEDINGNSSADLLEKCNIDGPLTGNMILALGSDSRWHRAKVQAVGEQMVSVFYLDYGIISEICIENIRKMPKKYLDIEPQAYQCIIPNLQCEDVKRAQIQLKKLILKQVLNGNIIQRFTYSGLVEVNVYNPQGKSIAEILVTKGHHKYI